MIKTLWITHHKIKGFDHGSLHVDLSAHKAVSALGPGDANRRRIGLLMTHPA